MKAMDDTPERLAIIRRMKRILHEDMPWIAARHPVAYTLVHEWCKNAYPNPVAFNTLKYMRIDPELRARRRAKWNRPHWAPVAIAIAIVILLVVPATVVAVRHVREG